MLFGSGRALSGRLGQVSPFGLHSFDRYCILLGSVLDAQPWTRYGSALGTMLENRSRDWAIQIKVRVPSPSPSPTLSPTQRLKALPNQKAPHAPSMSSRKVTLEMRVTFPTRIMICVCGGSLVAPRGSLREGHFRVTSFDAEEGHFTRCRMLAAVCSQL